MTAPLKLVTDGETEIIVTRHFKAPPELVFRAHVEPALIRRWMLGPDGWTMPVCANDARAGGHFRFDWTDGKGHSFYATGEYHEVTPHSRIVHVERMFLPDPTPDSHVVTLFEPEGSGTRFTMTMILPDAEARAAVLASGMADGLEDSYARLDAIL